MDHAWRLTRARIRRVLLPAEEILFRTYDNFPPPAFLNRYEHTLYLRVNDTRKRTLTPMIRASFTLTSYLWDILYTTLYCA